MSVTIGREFTFISSVHLTYKNLHSAHNLGIRKLTMFSQALAVRVDSIAHHLQTVFLFTKDDIRITLIPVVCDNYCVHVSLPC